MAEPTAYADADAAPTAADPSQTEPQLKDQNPVTIRHLKWYSKPAIFGNNTT
jgi:hypothetical protein